jgi:ABC-2 type transport system permease protein
VGYMRLALRCLGMSMRTLSARRGSFFLGLIGQLLVYGAEFLLMWLLIDRFHLIGGWTASEVLLLFSLNLASYGLAAFPFFSSVYLLGEKVDRGLLDQVLIWPMPALLGLVLYNLNLAYVMHVSLSLGCLVIALYSAGFIVTVSSVAMLLLSLAGAVLIQASLIILCGVLNFWSNQAGPGVWAIQWNLREFSKFPFTIYPSALQVFMTFVLPLGFISFYPAARILGKSPVPYAVMPELFTPLVGAALFAIALVVWRLGLRRYESAGS